MPKMRTFTFNDGKETKTVEALGFKRAVKSFQGGSKGEQYVNYNWTRTKK